MNAQPRNPALRWAIWGALSTTVLCGCMSQARPEWVRKMTFWEKEELDPRGVKAPNKRMVALKKLAEELPSSSPADQQAKAAELAEEYRNESDPLLKAQIAKTIARCGCPTAGEILTAAMRDSERDIRLAACEAWVTHGGPQMVPILSDAWRNDPILDVRLAAGRGLGMAKGDDVVAALAPGLEDPNPAVQYRAVASLRSSTGKDFGDDANAWREYLQGGSPKEISTASRMKLNYF
jgi:HEAT repeat protein